MISVLVGWILLTIAILLVANLLPGVRVRNLSSAIIAAAALGILNAVVRPILAILTLPLTIITLGLFLFVLNALMFQLAAALVPGFEVKSFWTALLAALIISVLSFLMNAILL